MCQITFFSQTYLLAFYASVEIRNNPDLKDKPIAVGDKAMLSTSSYEARFANEEYIIVIRLYLIVESTAFGPLCLDTLHWSAQSKAIDHLRMLTWARNCARN